ncbi:hypothetical protein IVIADoCa2_2 [Xanthomonas phage vB_Xar_IVIA-DoCa2]|uniref:BIG2 domain-containing protein n=1 Tax=Xanthomonas phage vB_Xar_IVIA-DoCa2 TaxID=2970491 RepID=A0A976SHA3_9CAUD|nr:hypothetical protein IVIADoCa2_2 [Xanthomonas phage vB_Xar_IVIA-DoCa2]
MLKSDFSNYTGLFGRGNYLVRELLALVEHAEKHPQTAAPLETLFNADVSRVQAAITAAKSRAESSGPGGGPLGNPATSLTLAPATASVAVGATTQLTATVVPADADGTTTYVSSDPGVATVSASGLVTGVAEGSATITATRGSKSDTSDITVTAE